jgi:Zn finger protein HypA/HybF involved in hydrogenase expression
MSSTEISLDLLLSGTGFQESAKSNAGKLHDTGATTAKTLESYHNQNISKIRAERDNLPELRAELAAKKSEFQAIENEFFSPAIITNASDIAILTGRQRLEKEIKELEYRIRMIESGETESDYFLRVGEILFSYTDAQDRIASGQKEAFEPTGKKQRMPANSVFSYFAATEHPEKEDVPVAVAAIENESKTASDIVTDIGFHRDKALETYLSALDPNNVHNDAAILATLEENYGNCPVCDMEMYFNETFLDCSECGFREYILVDSEKPSYKDPPREMSYYAYKKINHLNEWLAQFQAKETTEIAQSVLDQIRAELRKERITDMSKLKASKLKEVLKKLKLARCYDHVAHILNRLNGISAPVLSREVEEKLRFMFKEIQFSFVKHCPKKRSNFLSYSYVLYKFCELLELDEYLPCFPLLKSREKLYMQDKIWQLICQDMGWQFIRTV